MTPVLPGEPFPDAKPCPFCGTTRVTIFRSKPGEKEQWWTCCNGCAATGPWQKFRSAAVELWNQRPRKAYEKPAIVEQHLANACVILERPMMAIGANGVACANAATEDAMATVAKAAGIPVPEWTGARDVNGVARRPLWEQHEWLWQVVGAERAGRERAEGARDQARADVARYGRHTARCRRSLWQDDPRDDDDPCRTDGSSRRPEPACDCGFVEALARAKGRT